MIDDMIVTPPKTIDRSGGDLPRAMKPNDKEYIDFGEAFFYRL